MSIEFDSTKFREIVLYISKRSEDDRSFGATKLNKLLFYMDFDSYRLLGSPITGATYQHLAEGPAPRQLLTERDNLIAVGDAALEERERYSVTQHRLVPGREPNLDLFSQDELEIVENVLAKFRAYNAREISDHSHEEWGWRVTEDSEDIPYEAAWISSDPLTQAQIEVGREIAAKAGLLAT